MNLWLWSVTDKDSFWKSIWKYCKINRRIKKSYNTKKNINFIEDKFFKNC